MHGSFLLGIRTGSGRLRSFQTSGRNFGLGFFESFHETKPNFPPCALGFLWIFTAKSPITAGFHESPSHFEGLWTQGIGLFDQIQSFLPKSFKLLGRNVGLFDRIQRLLPKSLDKKLGFLIVKNPFSPIFLLT